MNQGDCADFNNDQGSCESTSGCSWSDPDCSGNYDNGACTGNFDNGVCNGTYGETCSGTPTACAAIFSEGSCAAQAGCTWSAVYIPAFTGDAGGSAYVKTGVTYDGAGGWNSNRPAMSIYDGTVRYSAQVVSSSKANIGTETEHPMNFTTNSLERMGITSAGNVTIGSPTSVDSVSSLDIRASNNTTTQYKTIILRPLNETQYMELGWNGFKASTTFNIFVGSVGLTIASSGNVGVGATSPESLFEVQGTEGNDATLTLDADDGDDAIDTWQIESDATTSDLLFKNSTSTRAVITDGGTVGIGTATPRATLDVVGGGLFSGNVGIGTATASASLHLHGASGLNFRYTRTGLTGYQLIGVSNNGLNEPNIIFTGDTTDNDKYMSWSYAGNLGLGENDADAKLEIIQTGTSKPLMISSVDSGDGDLMIMDAGGNVGIGTITPSTLLEVGARKFNVLSGGNVGVGTIAPESLLEVSGAEGGDATLSLDADEGDDNADLWQLESDATTNDLLFKNHTTTNVTFTDDGNVGVGTTNITAKLIVEQTGSADSFRVNDSAADTTPFLIDQAGNVGLGTTAPEGALIVRTSASSIGWSKQSAANQACNTTCTASCVFGQNTADFSIVDCADATADVCICAGNN